MKKSHILAVLALAMALGLAAPALLSSDSKASAEEGAPEGTTSTIERNVPDGMVAPVELDEANAETQTGDETISAEAASSLDELKAALASDAETIIIESTITLTEDLDLQGKTLKLADGLNRMFAIEQGNITIKNGTLSSNDDASQTGDAILWVTGSDADAGFENYTTLTVESDVKIVTKNSYGLAVHYLTDKQLARGVTINFAGSIDAPYGISVNGNIQDTENAPVINLTGTVTSSDDLAIFAAGYAEWHLNGATLTGATPLGLKSGKFILENSTLKATGAYNPQESTGSGMTPNGSTIQIENSQPYAGAIDIEVKSGTYESAQGPVFSEYGSTASRTAGSNLQRLAISGGTFRSAPDQPVFDSVSPAETVITGGNFSSDEGLEDYLEAGQQLVKDENGNFIIQTTNTPVTPENPDDKDDPDDSQKPSTNPGTQKPGSSSPDTGILATIEHAANAVGALGTTVITGVLVASGAALAWFIGSRRRQNSESGRKSSKKSTNSSKSGRNFHLDRIEVEISTTPKASPKSTKSSKTASKSSKKAAQTTSKTTKSSAKSLKSGSKTSQKSASKSAKTSSKASNTAKSASSRKTAATPRSVSKKR